MDRRSKFAKCFYAVILGSIESKYRHTNMSISEEMACEIARKAVVHADALIAELDKERPVDSNLERLRDIAKAIGLYESDEWDESRLIKEIRSASRELR